MQKKKIDHSFAYYKCLEKVGQNIPRFLEAPVVRMLRIRSASLKICQILVHTINVAAIHKKIRKISFRLNFNSEKIKLA